MLNLNQIKTIALYQNILGNKAIIYFPQNCIIWGSKIRDLNDGQFFLLNSIVAVMFSGCVQMFDFWV